MNDEKMMKGLRTAFTGVSVILVLIILVLQLSAFEALMHTILCNCVLLLITVTLIFDGILKDGKNMALHGGWYVFWFLNMIANLPTI